MVQNGQTLNINNLATPLPAPIIEDNILSLLDWSIPKENIETYKSLFNSLIPIDGKLAGSKVKPHMMKSKLPVDILTKVWDLSDVDQDGFLNLKEFILVCVPSPARHNNDSQQLFLVFPTTVLSSHSESYSRFNVTH